MRPTVSLLPLILLGVLACDDRTGPEEPPTPGTATAVSVLVSTDAPGPRIPADFLGLGFEMPVMADPRLRGGNPGLERLLAGIGPGTLRFGGNSVERTLWAPARGRASGVLQAHSGGRGRGVRVCPADRMAGDGGARSRGVRSRGGSSGSRIPRPHRRRRPPRHRDRQRAEPVSPHRAAGAGVDGGQLHHRVRRLRGGDQGADAIGAARRPRHLVHRRRRVVRRVPRPSPQCARLRDAPLLSHGRLRAGRQRRGGHRRQHAQPRAHRRAPGPAWTPPPFRPLPTGWRSG